MSCKLQTENISNILRNYLWASHNQLFLCRFHQFSVQSKHVHFLQWLQSTQSTFLFFRCCFFFPLPVDLTAHKHRSDLHYPFSRLPFSLVDYKNFIMCLTYIKFYYFLDAGSWRPNAVTHDLTDLNALTDSLVVTLSTDLLIFPLFELLMSGSTKLWHFQWDSCNQDLWLYIEIWNLKTSHK